MAANINDKFTETTNGSRPVPTTLTAILPSGASPGTATVGALTGWATATAVHFIIYTVDVNGNKVSGSQTDWKGIVSGSTITGLVLKAGTNNGYSIGAVVEAAPTAAWADDVVEGLDVEHNQDGTHDNTLVGMLAGTQTFTGNKTFSGVTSALLLKTNVEQGYMLNGKISRSVASNNLTVAIKGLDGNDPSATNPVYVRIGDTVRSITAALSITVNAGTNWWGLGASYFVSTDQDIFVYLVWNTTDTAVTIALGKEPDMRVYSDRDSTSTNHGYLVSSGSAPASTDEMEVVGRVNVTLGASASYNWSVPATSIVINRPIFETRTFSFTNTGSAGGTHYCKQIGSVKRVWGVSSSFSTSTSSTNVILTLPVGYLSTVEACVGSVRSVASIAQQYFVGNGISTTQWAYYVFCQSGSGSATASVEVIGS